VSTERRSDPLAAVGGSDGSGDGGDTYADRGRPCHGVGSDRRSCCALNGRGGLLPDRRAPSVGDDALPTFGTTTFDGLILTDLTRPAPRNNARGPVTHVRVPKIPAHVALRRPARSAMAWSHPMNGSGQGPGSRF